MKNKSIYSLLINADAEEKGRSIFETAVYALVVLSTAASIWAFASGEVALPGRGDSASTPSEAPASMIAKAAVDSTSRG